MDMQILDTHNIAFHKTFLGIPGDMDLSNSHQTESKHFFELYNESLVFLDNPLQN